MTTPLEFKIVEKIPSVLERLEQNIPLNHVFAVITGPSSYTGTYTVELSWAKKIYLYEQSFWWRDKNGHGKNSFRMTDREISRLTKKLGKKPYCSPMGQGKYKSGFLDSYEAVMEWIWERKETILEDLGTLSDALGETPVQVVQFVFPTESP